MCDYSNFKVLTQNFTNYELLTQIIRNPCAYFKVGVDCSDPSGLMFFFLLEKYINIKK